MAVATDISHSRILELNLRTFSRPEHTYSLRRRSSGLRDRLRQRMILKSFHPDGFISVGPQSVGWKEVLLYLKFLEETTSSFSLSSRRKSRQAPFNQGYDDSPSGDVGPRYEIHRYLICEGRCRTSLSFSRQI
jgi:hypothetical protein